MKGIKTSILAAAIFLTAGVAHAAVGTSAYTKTPNRYVTVDNTKIAYRTLGHRTDAPPLVLFQHFTGTMDDWDSSMIDELAKKHTLYIIDNAGIGASEGKAPDSVAGMAKFAEGFIDALHLKQVDVLGFSFGGLVAQQVIADRPELVRKAILVGTGPKGAEGFKDLLTVITTNMKKSSESNVPLKALLFFTSTPEGRQAGLEFVK